jgi:hypothetical protein
MMVDCEFNTEIESGAFKCQAETGQIIGVQLRTQCKEAEHAHLHTNTHKSKEQPYRRTQSPSCI